MYKDMKQQAVVDMDSLIPDILSAEQVPSIVKYCNLPVAVCDQGRLLIAGLSPVLRLIVSLAHKSRDLSPSGSSDVVCRLLGPRLNCLKACAEVSPWTKFCEVTIPNMIEKVLTNSVEVTTFDELLQLECYLIESAAQYDRQCHTAGRRRQYQEGDHHSKVAIVNKVNASLLVSDETLATGGCDLATVCKMNVNEPPYVEGDFLQLTDLVLFICFGLGLGKSAVLQRSLYGLGRVFTWYQTVSSLRCVKDAIDATGLSNSVLLYDGLDCLSSFVNTELSELNLNEDSLQNTAKLHLFNSFQTEINGKFKASQFAITSVLQKLREVCLAPVTVDLNSSTVRLPWHSYPNSVLPCTEIGGVPDKRADRKLEQLENMVAAVMKIVQSQRQESCVIVDFCSGGGHLGILLAYMLPHCKVRTCCC